MSDQYPKLTRSEFETLVLIYAAHADYNYTQEEEAYIRAYTNEVDYQKMYDYFNKHNDYTILKVILSHRTMCCIDLAARKRLYNTINQVFLADGDYSRPEKVFLEFLDRMIEDTNEAEA